MKPFFQTLKALSVPLCVSGAEESMAALLTEKMTPFCDEIFTDAMGNLICKKRSKSARETLLLCAHMDEIGFLVTDADENGFVLLAPLGGVRAEAAAYSRVRFESGRIGCLIPPHDTKSADLDRTKLLCDIGAKSRAAAKRSVRVGERCATLCPPCRLAGGRVSGRALDDRLGLAALLHTAEALKDEADLPYHLIFLFTVQEEVGARGGSPAAFATEPDYCINVDVTHADDAYGAKGPVRLGGGCTVKYKDRSVVCHKRMIDHIEACAKAENVKTQVEILTVGGTDTGPIQSSRAGVVSGAISLPLRYMHTDCETADLSDLEGCVTLLCACAKTPIR